MNAIGDQHGAAFSVEIQDKDKSPWSRSLDKAIPLEYLIWAGYMSTVIGMENKTKTVMGSYYQLVARGLLSGFPNVLNKTGKTENSFGVKGEQFNIIPYQIAAHKTRQLEFVKWRTEAFFAKRKTLIPLLTQKEPWQWDQKPGYCFWALAPHSVLLSSKAGFSRRSSYSRDSSKKSREPINGVAEQLSLEVGLFGEESIICPWMVFDGVSQRHLNNNPSPMNYKLWHLTIQIRFKTDRIYMCRNKNLGNRTSSAREGRDALFDPVRSLVKALAEKGLWQSGDTLFSALGWSQIVLFLSPRTLQEAFDFKNALQGREELYRTQTTFGTLVPEADIDYKIEKGISFQSTLRLGDIPDDGYNELQKKLRACKHFESVQEMPGIFDFQVTWKTTPTFYKIYDICNTGQEIMKFRNPAIPPDKLPYLISDIQTIVTRYNATLQ